MTDENKEYWMNRIKEVKTTKEKLRRAILSKDQKEIDKYTQLLRALKLELNSVY